MLLLSAPLALIPYVPALFVWLGASWYAFYRVLKAGDAGTRRAAVRARAPAVLINAVGGQNGCWTAALLGGGLSLLERRPYLAGCLFGLMIYKPQLAILLPVALIAGRKWRTFFAAGATAGCIAGAEHARVRRRAVGAIFPPRHGTAPRHSGGERRGAPHGLGVRGGAPARRLGRDRLYHPGGVRAGRLRRGRGGVVQGYAGRHPQRGAAARHLPGDALFAGLRSGVRRAGGGLAVAAAGRDLPFGARLADFVGAVPRAAAGRGGAGASHPLDLRPAVHPAAVRAGGARGLCHRRGSRPPRPFKLPASAEQRYPVASDRGPWPQWRHA